MNKGRRPALAPQTPATAPAGPELADPGQGNAAMQEQMALSTDRDGGMDTPTLDATAAEQDDASFDIGEVDASVVPDTYTIVEGDTLGDIAERFYGDVMKYVDIYEANRDIIDDPDLIYPGQRITLPDLGTGGVPSPGGEESPDLAAGGDTAMTWNVTLDAPTPTSPDASVAIDEGDFGKTDVGVAAFRDHNPVPHDDHIEMAVTLPVHIGFNVGAPNNQVDIPDESAGAITAGNYTTVADDLKPLANDPWGRAPRQSYWSRQFTTEHELYHVSVRAGDVQGAYQDMMAWLDTQTMVDINQVMAILDTAHSKYKTAFEKRARASPGENEAHARDVPKYQGLSDAIRAKGDAGGY